MRSAMARDISAYMTYEWKEDHEAINLGYTNSACETSWCWRFLATDPGARGTSSSVLS
jgi:hypothetical protein